MNRGTVYQRHLASCPRAPDGTLKEHRCRGQWGYVVDDGRGSSGRRRQVTRSGFATKRAASEALEKELARQQCGLAEVRSLRVGPYLEAWLTGKRRLRDTTRRHYRHYLDRYLLPSLGNYRLDELRPHHIDVLYTES
jgi:hypothetical protein